MSMRKRPEVKKIPFSEPPVRPTTHADPDRLAGALGVDEMPAGRMDEAEDAAPAALDDGGMPRGDMAAAAPAVSGNGGMPAGEMEGGAAGGGEMPAGSMEAGAPAAYAGEMPRGEMEAGEPSAGAQGEMPPLARGAGAAPGPSLELGGEWRLTLSTRFVRAGGA